MSSLLSSQLLASARKRLRATEDRTETDLRRATSDLYFSLFHRLCEALVEGLQPSDPVLPMEKEAWRRMYRMPDHAHIEKQCKDAHLSKSPRGVRLFANQLVNFKNKREDADYDPLARFEIHEVVNDIDIVESAISGFDDCDSSSRRMFALFVATKPRSGKANG